MDGNDIVAFGEQQSHSYGRVNTARYTDDNGTIERVLDNFRFANGGIDVKVREN